MNVQVFFYNIIIYFNHEQDVFEIKYYNMMNGDMYVKIKSRREIENDKAFKKLEMMYK